MLQRIKISVFNPNQIGKYVFDSFWRILLYIVGISFLCSIPVIIDTLKTDSLYSSTKTELKETIKSNKEALSDLSISDGKMMSSKSCSFLFSGIGVVINDNKVSSVINFIFQEESLTISLFTTPVFEYTYNQLGLDNLNINDLLNENENISYPAYRVLFGAINYVIEDLKPIWATAQIASGYIIQFVYYIITSLIMAFVIKFFSTLKFIEVLKIAIYGLTVAEFGMFFSLVFNFDILIYVCSLVSVWFTIKAVKILEFNKTILSNIIKK